MPWEILPMLVSGHFALLQRTPFIRFLNGYLLLYHKEEVNWIELLKQGCF